MYNGDRRQENYGILPNDIGDGVDLHPYEFAQAAWRGGPFAAISRDAPVKDMPVTLRNPFDFSQTNFGSLQDRYLWNKSMFDPRPLSINPFFLLYPDRLMSPRLFDPSPMNPVEGIPVLPPQFR